MTIPKTHHGYYVTARDGAAGRTAWLLGPFKTHKQASMMVIPVSRAAERVSGDPRFAFAGFGTAKLTRSIDRPLPPGRLDLTKAVDDVWVALVMNNGLPPEHRTWDQVFSDMKKTDHGSYRSD